MKKLIFTLSLALFLFVGHTPASADPDGGVQPQYCKICIEKEEF